MDDAALLEVAAGQYGLVSDEQALALGYSSRTIRRRVQSGEWSRPLPGVLRCTGAPVTERQAAMAAVLWAAPDACISHSTAGALWSLDGVRPRGIEISVGRDAGRRSARVRVHYVGTLVAADRTRLDEIPITNPTRTIVDLAGVLRPFELELAMEDAFRRGLSAPSAVAKRLEALGGSGRSGVRKLRRLLGERSGEQMSGSAAEVRLERLLVRRGLPSPVRQHDVTHGGRTVRVDLAYPEQREDRRVGPSTFMREIRPRVGRIPRMNASGAVVRGAGGCSRCRWRRRSTW